MTYILKANEPRELGVAQDTKKSNKALTFVQTIPEEMVLQMAG